nr:PAS domain-containing protein [uncultured Marinifilum sp.]
MSEFINNNTRIESIFQFCFSLIKGEKGTELIRKHQEAINSVTPNDIVVVVHRLVEGNLPMSDLKIGINKALNVFHKTIVSRPKIQLSPNHFLGIMMRENRELEKHLNEIKPLAKKINLLKDENEIGQTLSNLKFKVEELAVIDKHYSRKENVFFPYFENQYPEYKCLGVMWSIHDDIRKVRKDLVEALGESAHNLKRINKLMGDLFFFMNTIIFREDYLLFPVAVNAVSEDLWEEMNQQSLEIGFSFIDIPIFEEKKKIAKKGFVFDEEQLDSIQLKDTLLNFDTGLMTLQQAMMLLNNLPVDITMIDENDRVRFFSNPKDRFFTRSKAIIGRTVQNCHPPESVHIVDELLKAFKSGEKDSEPFWIQMKGRFILIQYFALRDENRTYKGCIEVSQDLTDIKTLEGEKRLM